MKNILAPHVRCDHARWLTLAVAGILVALTVVPTLNAQPAGQQALSPPPPAEGKPGKAWRDTNSWWCNIKFNGGTITTLKRAWMDTFTNDNFLITESAANVRLPAFEIRHVRLAELARSIAFLSQGALTVEVVDQLPATAGNIWRIGTPSPAEAPAVKMRAVAAPHVFADPRWVGALLESAQKMDTERLDLARQQVSKGIPEEMRTRVFPLPEQKVLVVMGTEDGIAGIESMIQASEQSAAESAQRFRGAK